MHDAHLFMQHLDYRRQAVGRARGRGKQVMLRRVVFTIVDAIDDIQRAIDRRSDDDLFHALVEIDLQLFGLAKTAGGLDDDIAGRPVGIGNRLVAGVADAFAIDQQILALDLADMRETAVHRVELKQVSRAVHVAGRLVDLDDIEFVEVPAGAQAQPAHASETVDADTGSTHDFSPLQIYVQIDKHWRVTRSRQIRAGWACPAGGSDHR